MDKVNDVESSRVHQWESRLQNKLQQKSPTQKKKGSARKSHKKWKKPLDKPKHPLTAYNLFYQFERTKILGTNNQRDPSNKSKIEFPNQQGKNGCKEVSKDKKISFFELTKTIASRWKSLDKDTRAIFEERAGAERERYQREIAEWEIRTRRRDPEEDNNSECLQSIDQASFSSFMQQQSQTLAPIHHSVSPHSVPTSETPEEWHDDSLTTTCHHLQNTGFGCGIQDDQNKEPVLGPASNKYSEYTGFSPNDGPLLSDIFSGQQVFLPRQGINNHHEPFSLNSCIADSCLDQFVLHDDTAIGNKKILPTQNIELNSDQAYRKELLDSSCQGNQSKIINDFAKVSHVNIMDHDNGQAFSLNQTGSFVLSDNKDHRQNCLLIHPYSMENNLTWHDYSSVNCNVSTQQPNDIMTNHQALNPSDFQATVPVLGDPSSSRNNFPVIQEQMPYNSNEVLAHGKKQALRKMLDFHVQEMQRISAELCMLESNEQICPALHKTLQKPTNLGTNRSTPNHGSIHHISPSLVPQSASAINPDAPMAGMHNQYPYSTFTTSGDVLYGQSLHPAFPKNP